MEQLIEQMKVALADTFTLYLKAQNFHWNVEGTGFPQYHSFLGDLYSELWSAVDPMAEHIRTLDAYVPGSMSRFLELATVQEDSAIPVGGQEMCRVLYADNRKVIISLIAAQLMAAEAKEIGIDNFLQDRIDAHKKHDWMLRSIAK